MLEATLSTEGEGSSSRFREGSLRQTFMLAPVSPSAIGKTLILLRYSTFALSLAYPLTNICARTFPSTRVMLSASVRSASTGILSSSFVVGLFKPALFCMYSSWTFPSWPMKEFLRLVRLGAGATGRSLAISRLLVSRWKNCREARLARRTAFSSAGLATEARLANSSTRRWSS
ncbi:unnamed protein product [Pseudo-nitzschia multistriata]|uniref:Uncharacterized protein n=1 Tax=Pseudo-nitzschia multistriata TaxID=183589 RepID=A0A448Z7X8_9STRA|nr:unnamed protein product [Pseudo-nitzschia multistriata]